MALEEAFDIEIPDKVVELTITVEQVVIYISSKITT